MDAVSVDVRLPALPVAVLTLPSTNVVFSCCLDCEYPTVHTERLEMVPCTSCMKQIWQDIREMKKHRKFKKGTRSSDGCTTARALSRPKLQGSDEVNDTSPSISKPTM